MNARNEEQAAAALLDTGNRALVACDWTGAREAFQRAVEISETPGALEGLGMAAWWLDDVEILFQSREQAYTLYREAGDAHGAARMAMWLALDNFIYWGAPAIANGWLKRGEHRLSELEYPSFEHGFMCFTSGYIALEQHDLASARVVSLEGIHIARTLELIDLEMLSLALYGLVLVSQGSVDEGMRYLDEAVTAAHAGEMTDQDAIVTCCCYLFYACERVRDYDRATQWCDRIKDLCEQWSYRSMFAVCRTHYAGVLLWRGEWQTAETELTEALNELMAGRVGWANEGWIRLAELRRRQGRADEAARLLRRAAVDPRSLLGKAELALDAGDPVGAIELVDRFLRQIPADELTERVNAHELAIRISVETGDDQRAREALAELETAAKRIETEPLRGMVSFARGLVTRAAGDIAGSRRHFEDAVDLYLRIGAPYETAVARIELATDLHTVGRDTLAAAEAREALSTLERIGAQDAARRAAKLLTEIGLATSKTERRLDLLPGMTRRESEILALIARGYTNPQIADELFLSVRTVERHISSIYQKIGAEGKAARAMATAFALEHAPQHPG
jgi:LuxR family transcriptional regulator, maltose regulon positive regulatory protein